MASLHGSDFKELVRSVNDRLSMLASYSRYHPPGRLSDFVDYILYDRIQKDTSEDDRHDWQIGHYYPHTVGQCLLRYYYIYRHGGPAPLSDSARARVTAGTIVHAYIQDALADAGYSVEHEFDVDLGEGAHLIGHADAYFPGSDLYAPHVVEIKTVRALPNAPYLHHLLQVSAYMLALDVPRAVLLYVALPSFQRKFFEVSRTPLISYVREWVLKLHRALVTVSEPNPTPIAHWECRSCPLKSVCPIGRLLQMQQ